MPMKPLIGCLHAHHSNIRFFEQGFDPERFGFMHWVDPGLIHWLTRSGTPDAPAAPLSSKLADQLQWMAGCGVDAIVITCTNYAAGLPALAPDVLAGLGVPVIGIDEPWFAELLRLGGDAVVAFTNPATVEGTMRRLHAYAAAQGRTLQAEAAVAEADCFALLLEGRAAEYEARTRSFLAGLGAQGRTVAAAQLSMADAAVWLRDAAPAPVIEPLGALRKFFA